MKANKQNEEKLSYESDGKMGKGQANKKSHNKKDQNDFFNITQNSE